MAIFGPLFLASHGARAAGYNYVTNYRPISILPVISKVYEKVFYGRLYDYFSTNNILSSAQFGFRSGASTELAQLKLTDDILKCFDDNVGIATFRDLSKAFDCVDHKIVLTNIKQYGVHSTPLRWIRSYLSKKEHFVSWNHIQSTPLNLNIGVPLRTILGPHLFLVSINDIVNLSNVLSFVLFADDTTVYVQNDSIDSAIEILNTELGKVALWFDSNKLTLKVNKTQMIMLSRKKILTPQNEVVLRNEVVQGVNKAKFLGVIVDQHLKLERPHFNDISKNFPVMRQNTSNS